MWVGLLLLLITSFECRELTPDLPPSCTGAQPAPGPGLHPRPSIPRAFPDLRLRLSESHTSVLAETGNWKGGHLGNGAPGGQQVAGLLETGLLESRQGSQPTPTSDLAPFHLLPPQDTSPPPGRELPWSHTHPWPC